MKKRLFSLLLAAVLAIAPVASVEAAPVAKSATVSVEVGMDNASKTKVGEVNAPKNLKKSTAKKTSAAIKWTKDTKNYGYEIEYSTDKKFAKGVKKASADYKASSKTLTGLKANTTYYVRIRSYIIATAIIDGKTKNVKIYSAWKTVTVKTTKK